MSSVELKLMTFKAHPDDIAGWKARAKDQKMTFSAWARMKMNATDDLPPIRYKQPEPLAQVVLERAYRLDVATVKPSECTNRLRPGTWCGKCGETHK